MPLLEKQKKDKKEENKDAAACRLDCLTIMPQH